MSHSFQTYNPTSGELLGSFFYSRIQDVQSSIELLSRGEVFVDQQILNWAHISFTQRQQVLFKLHQVFSMHADSLALIMTQTMGKPISQSKAEVKKCLTSIYYLLTEKSEKLLCRSDLFEIPLTGIKIPDEDSNKTHSLYFKPKGVIVGLMPWNFPLWQAVRMFMPALLMGNRILLKHSEITFTLGQKLEMIFAEAGLGSLLKHHLWAHADTEKIIQNSAIGGVSLTGSTSAGIKIAELCAKSLKPSVLELGGNDVALMLEDASIELTVEKVLESRLQNTGQSCIALKRFYVPTELISQVKKEIQEKLNKFNFGDVFDSATRLSSLAHVRFKKENEEKNNILQKEFQLWNEVMPPEETSEFSAYVPLRIWGIEHEDQLSSEMKQFMSETEFFSPTLIIVGYEDENKVIQTINHGPYGLAGSVFSNDLDKAFQIASQMQTGMVTVNDFTKSDVTIPFGGVKFSGWGKELGSESFFEFVDQQVISRPKVVSGHIANEHRGSPS